MMMISSRILQIYSRPLNRIISIMIGTLYILYNASVMHCLSRQRYFRFLHCILEVRESLTFKIQQQQHHHQQQ